MSCYHPLKGLKIGEYGNGKTALKIVPYDSIDVVRNDGREYEYILLPCGHCLGCRMDQSREWSNRLLMESQYHDESYFLTLTYDDKLLYSDENWKDRVTYRINPDTGETKLGTNLSVRDVQLFFKNLRFNNPDDSIRYYLVGEYGPKTMRAHYHAIIFGLHIPVKEMIPCGRSETGNEYFTCDRIAKCWKLGYHSIEPANYYTFKYVSAYVTSKVGKYPNEFWKERNLKPPFATMSRKPGIGAQYLIDHVEIMENDKIVISTDEGKVEFKPPRYFKKSFKEVFPNKYEEISKRNVKRAEDKNKAQLEKTDKSFTEMLLDQEKAHYARLKARKDQ